MLDAVFQIFIAYRTESEGLVEGQQVGLCTDADALTRKSRSQPAMPSSINATPSPRRRNARAVSTLPTDGSV